VIRRWDIWLALVAASFLPTASGSAAADEGAVAPTVISMPSSIKADCSVADSAGILTNWLNSLPANSTVNFPANGCFLINSTLWVHNTTGLTINANNSWLVQSVAPAVPAPFIFLTQDTNLAMSNAVVVGAYNGTNGGADQEGDYGFLLEADHGVTLTHLNVNDIQGDFINLNAPDSGDTGNDISLNTNITIQSSSFTNAGFHGLTVESVNGLKVNQSTFTNMGVDAMDFEYDVFSTTFDGQGNPQEAAQDNVCITNDTWTNFKDDWFASMQGQLPGVQQANVVLYNNVINAASPLIVITGTNPYLTPSQFWNKGLLIALNKGLQPAISTTGGSIADPPGNVAAMSVQGVVNATIAGNSFPLFDGMPDYFANTPYIAVMQVYEDQNLIIRDNDLSGAYDILQTGSSGNTVTECNNFFGVNDATNDGTC
jgi:hypothetical protein